MVEKVVRHAQRASGERIVEQIGHLGDFIRRCRTVPCVETEHGETQCEVADKAGVVGRDADVLDHRGLVFRPLFPIPRQVLEEWAFRDIFEEGENFDHFVTGRLVARDRRGGKTAIAHDDRGHAIAGQRIKIGLPPHRGVIVGVAFHEPGGDVAIVSEIGLFTVRLQVSTDFGDHAVRDADIAFVRGGAGAIDDGATLDQQIRHYQFSQPKRLFDLFLYLCGGWRAARSRGSDSASGLGLLSG